MRHLGLDYNTRILCQLQIMAAHKICDNKCMFKTCILNNMEGHGLKF